MNTNYFYSQGRTAMMAIQVYRMRLSPGSVGGSSGKSRPGSHSSPRSAPLLSLVVRLLGVAP